MNYYGSFSFILLAVFGAENQVQLLTWIFVMRFLMIVTSVLAYWINGVADRIYAAKTNKFDFEKPLTNLVWLTSILSILMTFGVSYKLLASMGGNLWLVLSAIISCGTLGAALIPEFTKIFTSPKAKHTEEVAKYALFDESKPGSLRPEKAEILIDRKYILAAMGLLSQHYPLAALEIMKKEIAYYGLEK